MSQILIKDFFNLIPGTRSTNQKGENGFRLYSSMTRTWGSKRCWQFWELINDIYRINWWTEVFPLTGWITNGCQSTIEHHQQYISYMDTMSVFTYTFRLFRIEKKWFCSIYLRKGLHNAHSPIHIPRLHNKYLNYIA